jgi:Ca2+-binding RTX toxin-like protein
MVSKRFSLGGLVVALGLSFVTNAEARTRCSYTGPPTNTLTVTTTGEELGEISRLGQQILVGEAFERPRACSGGDPSVLNTDTIMVATPGFITSVDLRLGGGLFVPGATAEAEGASEIEVVFSGRDAFGEVVGTPHADEFHWGPGEAGAGLNLNPRSSGDQDVDVTVDHRRGFLIANGAAGNDRIIPAPGARVSHVFSEGGRGDDVLVAPQNSSGNLEGESGDDVLTGGRSFDDLEGGSGNDRVLAGSGHDQVDGGHGRDLLSGGRGHDSISAQDSKRDVIRCGPGRDRVRADQRDRLRGCERVSRR